MKDAAGHSSPYSAIDSFTTVVAIAAAPALVSPTDGQTGVSLTPTMTWNNAATAATGAVTYRLQIAGALAFGSASVLYQKDSISDTSFAVATTLTNNTKYYWRVGVKDAAGHSSPYSTIDSFTTVVVIAAAPGLVSPAEGATGVSVTPTMTWNNASTAATGSVTYRLQIAGALAFGSASVLYQKDSISDTSFAVATTLTNNAKYYWRVGVKDAAGHSSPYSAVDSFTTVVTIAAAPGPCVPADGATGVSLTPTMTWNNASTAATGAVTYRLQVASALAFGSASVLYQKDSISDTSFAVATTLTNNTKYYWRVGVKDAARHSSPYSTVDSFTTVVTIAAAPGLVSPAEGQTGVSLTPTMTRNNAATAATGPVTYRLQIAGALAFGSASVLYQKDSISDTSFAVATTLTNNATYYSRVGVKDAGGSQQPVFGH